jgi:hypothetical protein
MWGNLPPPRVIQLTDLKIYFIKTPDAKAAGKPLTE